MRRKMGSNAGRMITAAPLDRQWTNMLAAILEIAINNDQSQVRVLFEAPDAAKPTVRPTYCQGTLCNNSTL